MEKAYILIGCELGAEGEIVEKIKHMEKVKDARVVYGDYDIVVEAEASTDVQLDNLITKKIRKMEKVRSTMTLGVVSEFQFQIQQFPYLQQLSLRRLQSIWD